MKCITTSAAILALASQQVSAHCTSPHDAHCTPGVIVFLTLATDIFQSVTVAGTKNAPYTYVRKNTNGNSPVTGIFSSNMNILKPN